MGSNVANKTEEQRHKEFVKALSAKWGSKVKCLDRYAGCKTPIRFKCDKGHVFVKTPTWVKDISHTGCVTCGKFSKRKSLDTFLEELKVAQPQTLLIGEYLGDGKHTLFQCDVCGKLRWVTPNVALRNNCNFCAQVIRNEWQQKNNRVTAKTYTARLGEVNPDIELVSPFNGLTNPVTIRFPCGHSYNVARAEHYLYRKFSCLRCLPVGYSRVALTWLEGEAKKRRCVIQHAESGGEFTIPGTRYKVDGYNHRSKTVFEFMGDYWHKRRASYQSSLGRLRRIASLGYTVVYIWHSEFVKGKPAKVIK